METRRHDKIFLLDHDESQIIGAKLPSKGQVLRVLFYNLRKVKLSIRAGAHLAVKEAEILWEKARIPIRRIDHSVGQLEAMYQKWRMLQKSSKRRTPAQERHEQEFLDELDDLFDIAHADALNMITIEEDKQFLINPRKKGRPGSMMGGDRLHYEREQKQMLRQEMQEARQARFEMATQETETIEFASSSSNEEHQEFIENPLLESDASDTSVNKPGPSKPKKKRGLKQVVTLKLVSTLDKCKISDRDAVRIITATAQALGHDISDLNINRTSIRRFRTRLRTERYQTLRSAFPQNEIETVTVHWDSKILPALMGNEKVERLSVIISSRGHEQLLGIPAIESSSGRHQALAVCDLLKEWDLNEKVQVLSCDTTASNMGRLKGACSILEHEIGRDLLYLPCRHHIYELVLRAVFEEKMSKSSGPQIPLFKRFQEAWPSINKLNFHTGMEDPFIAQKIRNASEITNFSRQTLHIQQPREDYREFIELVLIFLGETLPQYYFRAPGAFHHARWMAKGIYCLKIFLFREEFLLSVEEKNGMRDICIFIVNLYLKAWTEAHLPTKAPQQDLDFMKALHKYKEIDVNISRVTLQKFCNHLWYLSPEAAAFSLFDNDIPINIKTRIVNAFTLNTDSDSYNKKFIVLPINVDQYLDKDIACFISNESMKLFDRFKIPTDFLKNDPATWENDESFKVGLSIIKQLRVVNDTAERAIKLMSDYNKILARDEEEKQLILHIVSDYRKQYPDVRKSTLAKNM